MPPAGKETIYFPVWLIFGIVYFIWGYSKENLGQGGPLAALT
jgi:hypothetical protein